MTEDTEIIKKYEKEIINEAMKSIDEIEDSYDMFSVIEDAIYTVLKQKKMFSQGTCDICKCCIRSEAKRIIPIIEKQAGFFQG